MARVDFGQLCLTPVADVANGIAIEVHDISHSPATAVEIRPYAGGNYRAVRQKGKQKTSTVALNFCTDAQVAWLKDQQGQLLCYRDPTGEKFFGIYGADQISFAPRQMGDSWAVALTVALVTWTAA